MTQTLHPEYKKRIIMYVTTLMNGAGIKYDRDKTIEVWLNSFSYIKTTTQYMEFENACNSILNNDDLMKMPMPGRVKRIIEENRVSYNSLGDKPVRDSKHKELFKKSQEIRIEAERITDVKEKAKLMDEYWELCKKMCAITNTPFIKGV